MAAGRTSVPSARAKPIWAIASATSPQLHRRPKAESHLRRDAPPTAHSHCGARLARRADDGGHRRREVEEHFTAQRSCTAGDDVDAQSEVALVAIGMALLYGVATEGGPEVGDGDGCGRWIVAGLARRRIVGGDVEVD